MSNENISIGQKIPVNKEENKSVEEQELSILDLVEEGSIPEVHTTKVAGPIINYLKNNAN